MNWGVPDRLRSGGARAMVQVAIVLALFLIAWQVNGLTHDAEQSASETTAVNSILAQSCGAATFAELREQGLVEECRLAQAGVLADSIPDSALPEPDAEPGEVNPDVIKDDTTSTPADLRPPEVSTAQVRLVVEDYFADNPIDAQPGYQRAISRTVATYLTQNPPEPGRPPTDVEVARAARIALAANPPADGTNGQDGTDGQTGPQGPQGPPPTNEQIAAAVAAYCTANGECRGPAGADGTNGQDGQPGPPGTPGVVRTADNCNPIPGEYVTDVSISGPEGDGPTITLSCTTASVLPGNSGGTP